MNLLIQGIKIKLSIILNGCVEQSLGGFLVLHQDSSVCDCDSALSPPFLLFMKSTAEDFWTSDDGALFRNETKHHVTASYHR